MAGFGRLGVAVPGLGRLGVALPRLGAGDGLVMVLAGADILVAGRARVALLMMSGAAMAGAGANRDQPLVALPLGCSLLLAFASSSLLESRSLLVGLLTKIIFING